MEINSLKSPNYEGCRREALIRKGFLLIQLEETGQIQFAVSHNNRKWMDHSTQ